jgi:hypothetical protein
VRLAGHKHFTVFEWAVIIGFAAVAIVVADLLGLHDKWNDVFVYTVVLFGVVLLALRPAWGRRTFWTNAIVALSLHLVAVIIVVQALPVSMARLPWLVLIGIGMLEGLLLAGLLWKGARKGTTTRG